MHNAYIEIDKQQFIQNIEAIRRWVNKRDSAGKRRNPNIKFCLPVKANAYGHGLVQMAQTVQWYVDYLAVACLDEGVTLRQNGITKPILVFGSFSFVQIYYLITNHLEFTISSLLEANMVIEICKEFRLFARVHVKVDTGMNRVGVQASQALELIDFVNNSRLLYLAGVYSHLASSDRPDDEITHRQISQFTKIVQYVRQLDPDIICHLANSGGVCYYPDSYFDMVRPGIFSYGYFPGARVKGVTLNKVRPCFSLKSLITYLKVVAPNSAISYNQRYITPIETKIATLPIGYGDGYRRVLSNCGEVLIHGRKYTISGTVCMDMTMVDIGLNGEGAIGDEVVLIGNQGLAEISLISVAEKCNTITYEVLCGFTERLPRIYI